MTLARLDAVSDDLLGGGRIDFLRNDRESDNTVASVCCSTVFGSDAENFGVVAAAGWQFHVLDYFDGVCRLDPFRY